MKQISLIKNMSELGAGTRGSSLGADALIMAAHKLGKDLFSRYDLHEIPNHNDLLFNDIGHIFAKYIDGIRQVIEEVGTTISGVLKSGKIPFVLSGDHSNAAATIFGIKSAFPDKRLGVIWVDAHGDLHSPYTTPSGNMHGMPLAISLGIDHKGNQINQPDEETVRKWNELKNLGGICPKIQAEDLVFFAVRDIEELEQKYIKDHEIRNFTVAELRYRGMQECLKETNGLLSGCDLIYVSFDVDSMDCNLISHGTGTPVERGLSMKEAEAILLHFASDPRLISFEMVEINPLLDEKGNFMAETSVRILDNIIRKITD